ncbi:MAG: SNF2-related protein [Bacteroidales bacterium]|nr:SNF2-related protein [Bacteroidales bacterium]
MATRYGKTWWGEQWLGALKHIDYSSRLPRGAAYARNGMVQEIVFNGNHISAKVKGSRRTPYSEKIELQQFTKKDIDKLMKLIGQQPVVLSKLFNRQLDESIVDMAEKAGLKLFPQKWSDLKMYCSCPDWAVPCKHLAAVIYKISMEIDNNPFLVFSLHGIDLFKELENRGMASVDATSIEVDDIKTVWGEGSMSLNIPEETPRLDYSSLSNLTLPLSNLLPVEPAFCHERDFRIPYQKQMTYISKNAGKVLDGKLQLCGVRQPSLTKRSECAADDIYKDGVLQQLLEIDEERLTDYQPSTVELRRMLTCCLQLIAHGCVVPQIFSETTTAKARGRAKAKTETKYRIVWQPAMIDDTTKGMVKRLGQEPSLVCRLITALIPHLSYTSKDDILEDLFFNGYTYAFAGIGETNTPGGIRSWLDRYFMQSKHETTFVVNETDDGFAVDVHVDGFPLKVIMGEDAFANNRLEMLATLSVLCDVVGGLDRYINGKGHRPMEFLMSDFAPFLLQVIPTMQLFGVKAVLPKALQKLIRPQVTVRLKARSKDSVSSLSMSDLLTFDWQVAVGNECLSPEVFNELLAGANGLIRFKEQYVYMDEAAMAKLRKALVSPPRLKQGELLQVALAGEYQGTSVAFTDEVREMISRLTSQSDIPLPKGIRARLRPYQERGFSWMYRNLKIGFGSIIADDMGLGKTLQVITLLLKIKEEGALGATDKALVVVPTGLLHNWQQEINRFAPTLTTFIYHGSDRNLTADECKAADIILSTYGVVRSDVTKIKKQSWQVLVIDEAQNIKNNDTAQSKALASIPANTYIAMSGTPVENRLSEFWSIINFTNKGYLGTLKDFTEHYARPIQREGDMRVAERFRKVTAPFMMRRLKTDKSIITDLPDKIERNEWAQLTAEQAALYQKTVDRCMAVIEGMEGKDSQTLFQRQGLILQMMLALKQICNHPTQFLKDGRMDAALSGKTEMLLDVVRSIVDSNEKALIFTQFREMGELLRHFIAEALGEEPMFYHGGCSLKQRQEMVDRFQQNRSDRIFILSLKAAGTGLNLTAATHVVHYDLWWNPAVEAQATDRAYRIGQHSNVQVHRFITQDTFEERIDKMIQEKRHLADITVATGENWIGKLSNKELREVFG